MQTVKDDQLQSENESLRKLRDEQKAQLDEVHVGLADAKAQLHRLRLGVSDKENLEKEKRALEKNNQILSARLNDLGKTVDDLTQSQQSEKPFPQLSWMDAAETKDWIDERDAKELSLSESDVPALKVFATELQQRIAQAEDNVALYFQTMIFVCFSPVWQLIQMWISWGLTVAIAVGTVVKDAQTNELEEGP